MVRIRSIWPILGITLCAALAGCRATNQLGSITGGNNGNSSVVLAMTDTPPSNVSILSAELTLTGATLAPGSVSLFSGSKTVELTRLQTDIGYIATASNIPAGTYTSVMLTFANPSLTFENDTAATLAGCAVGAICTIVPATSTMSATVPLTSFSIASSSTTGLLIDIDLENFLSATLGADFNTGTTVTSFTPAGFGAPPVGAEDVVGQVGNINASSSTFTLTNASGSYSLKVGSASNFFQFPTSACASPGFSCLQNNQIVSVDIGIESNGSIQARNIVFEDANNTDAEVEGVITSTNAGSQQFNMIVLTVSTSGTGLAIGGQATVQYSTSPQTVFDIDFLHIDNLQEGTTSFSSSFTGPIDLVPGQQVSIRRNSSSAGTILADRVRLRSSRITATVLSINAPNITLTEPPSFISGHNGVNQIQVQTSITPPTIFFEIGHTINISDIALSSEVSVRGPLFDTGGANRTLLATKVVVKP